MPVEGKAFATRKIEPERRRTCSACGMMGHLSTTCETNVRHHDKLGIEIEGFWHDLVAAKRQAEELTGRRGNSDGSLPGISSCRGNADPEDPCGCGEDDCTECNSNAGSCSGSCRACGARSWEFQTRPGSLGEALRQLTQLYPDVVNAACGMHCHMSFLDKSSVTMLTSDEFFAFFRDRFKTWGERHNVKGEFWKRLNDENSYCRHNRKSDWHRPGAAVTESSDRYRQINFLAYAEHQTVEFRLLPMFRSAALAVSAIEELVSIVESYLGSAVLSHAADSGVVAPQRIEGLAAIDQEIPLAISQAARDALLPRSIDREIEIVDTADVKGRDGATIVHAYQLRDRVHAMADKLHADLDRERQEARKKARIR